MEEVVVRFVIRPGSVNEFFENSDNFFREWIETKEPTYGNFTYVVIHINQADKEFIELFNKKFKPSFSISYVGCPYVSSSIDCKTSQQIKMV